MDDFLTVFTNFKNILCVCPNCQALPRLSELQIFSSKKPSKDWMNDYQSRLLEQRNLCIQRITSIDGLEVTKPNGAFYMFVRIRDEKWKSNDKDFVLKLLHEKNVLLVHGSGFSPEYGQGHFRLVFLPGLEILNEAFDRIEKFLLEYK